MPLSYLELTTAYVSGSVARGFLTGISIFIATSFFVPFSIHNIFILILYGLFATTLFGSIGILIALMAKQFDHLGVFNTFFLTPLTMLGGVFYSIKILPPLFQKFVLFNPLFYLIDGFRYGLLGISDAPLIQGMIISAVLSIGFFSFVVYLMKKGYKVKQ
jgi:ABC-2 type transport system permease protein